MEAQQLTAYQQQLQQMQAALLAQVAAQRGGIVGRAQAAAEHFGHPEESPAQTATERDLEFAIGEHETAHLTAIDAALSRIKEGTYGECTDCGTHIPAARLQAQPEALRCIPCQTALEQHHQHA